MIHIRVLIPEEVDFKFMNGELIKDQFDKMILQVTFDSGRKIPLDAVMQQIFHHFVISN